MEAYGSLDRDPNQLHGSWSDAQAAVVQGLQETLGSNWESDLNRLKALRARPGSMIHTGSGWGTLENLRRQADGEVPLSPTFDFPESALTAGQLHVLAIGPNVGLNVGGEVTQGSQLCIVLCELHDSWIVPLAIGNDITDAFLTEQTAQVVGAATSTSSKMVAL